MSEADRVPDQEVAPTEGMRIVAALGAWLGSDEGARCQSGQASGRYLENRLWLAYMQGWSDAKADAARPSVCDHVFDDDRCVKCGGVA